MKHWGKIVLGNYDNKGKIRGGGASQSNQWNQVWKGNGGIFGTLSQGAYILNTIHFLPTNKHAFLVGFLKEVLKNVQVIKYQNIAQICAQKFVQVLFQDKLSNSSLWL